MTQQNTATSHQLGALLGLHVQTSLHAGAGTALGTVDLPIQRERHTGWPNIAGSALKGIFRDACRERAKSNYAHDRRRANEQDEQLTAAFGPATSNADAHAGAITITDARLLAFPVRSLTGVFAWVSCPQALERLGRDARLAGYETPFKLPAQPSQGKLHAPNSSPCVFADADKKEMVILEEFDFQKEQTSPPDIAEWIAATLLPAGDSFKSTRDSLSKRLLILHDDDFTHFARHATEVTARIGLDYETKTVKKGALFYQEFLPAESILYAVVLARPSRKDGHSATAKDMLKVATQHLPEFLQIGGDETTGKGICAQRLSCAQGGVQ